MRFIALDVETANANMASICSVGAAVFEDGEVKSEWYSLIDPQDYFDPMNISVHGIQPEDVRGAPTFKQTLPTLTQMLTDNVVVTHTHFDRVALHQAASRCSMPPLTCRWLDSARVVRRTWADCASSGYGLKSVCKRIGYEFDHHNALADAKASGHVLLAALRDSGIDLEAWFKRVSQPIDMSNGSSGAIRREGKEDGPMAGEVIVFTGALEVPRREAADLAAAIGCDVGAGVTKKTTMLVVGDTDVQRLAGHEKSSKHRKAEELIADGYPIRIVRETDFRKLVALT